MSEKSSSNVLLANTKFHRLDAVCAEIAKGIPLEYACALGGVTYRTVRRWIVDEERLGAESKFAGVVAKVEAAKARAIQANMANITRAGGDDWRASAWILERRHPHLYARTTRVVGADDGAVEVNVGSEAEAAARILARIDND